MWGKRPLLLLFDVIVILLSAAALLLICRKLWICSLSLGLVVSVVGVINCVKLAANGDNFYPWDLSMAKNAGQLIGFARFDLPPLFFVIAPLFLLFTVLYALVDADIMLKWYIRLPGACALITAAAVIYSLPDVSGKILEKFGMSFNDNVLQSSNYHANGFTAAFTLNCLATKVTSPEGYSEKAVTDYIGSYLNQPQSDFAASENGGTAPDIIVVLSEAFFDVRTLKGTTFSQNPLENFDKISARESAYTGKLVTTAMGGGTVRTEFEILTGLTADYLVNGTSPYMYVSRELETSVSNYKAQGYRTTGIHSYDGSFYMRNSAYPKLGFDEFITQDDMEKDAEFRRGYITDKTLTNYVINTLENNSDSPNFIFAITMENHQSYGKTAPEDVVVRVENSALDGDVLDAVTTYTQGVYYADLSLGRLVDYIDSRKRDTALLFFGDHLPSLGSNRLAFIQTGTVSNGTSYTAADREYLYSTPFLFYSNFGADFESAAFGQKKISTYHMMPLLARACGTEMTPYMRYLYDNLAEHPYYNVRINNEISDEGKDFVNSLKLITYDRVKGKRYSLP